jgi:hypothetical protein
MRHMMSRNMAIDPAVAFGLAWLIAIRAHDVSEARQQAMATGCADCFRATDSGGEVLECIRCAVTPPQANPANDEQVMP